MAKKKVVIIGKKKKAGKRTRKANKGALEWVLGQQDLRQNPIYQAVRNTADRVAHRGPIGIFKGKGKMGDMRNARLRGGGGKISSVAGSSSNSRPYITTIGERMERVNTVVSTVDFQNNIQCALNPGLSTCFPWLSTVAANYELYSFKKLWFEYRTTSGEVMSGTNPALGKVIMATNYDVIQPPFPDIIAMENYEGNANFPPYQKYARHTVDVNGRSMAAVLPYTRRYIRTGPVPDTTAEGGSGDPHAYDVGLFQVGTQGMPADGNQVGELWVGYSIDLIKPRPTQLSSGGDMWSATGLGQVNPVTGENQFMQKSTQVVYAQSSLGVVTSDNPGPSFATTVTITKPASRYFAVSAYAHGTSGAFNGIVNFGTLVNCIYADLGAGVGGNKFGGNDTDACTSVLLQALTDDPMSFNVDNPGATGEIVISTTSSIFISTFMPTPLFTHRVFSPRDLVSRKDVDDLRKQLASLVSRYEDDEKSDSYSVISSLARQRNPSPVRSVRK